MTHAINNLTAGSTCPIVSKKPINHYSHNQERNKIKHLSDAKITLERQEVKISSAGKNAINSEKNNRSHIFLCENHTDYRAKFFIEKIIKLLNQKGFNSLSFEMNVDKAEILREDRSFKKRAINGFISFYNDTSHDLLFKRYLPEEILKSPEKVEITLNDKLGEKFAYGMTEKILAEFLQNDENKIYGIDLLESERNRVDMEFCLLDAMKLSDDELCIKENPHYFINFDRSSSLSIGEYFLDRCGSPENINFEKIHSVQKENCTPDLAPNDYLNYIISIEKEGPITFGFRDKKIAENIISIYKNNDKMIYWMGKAHCDDVANFLKENSDVLFIDTLGYEYGDYRHLTYMEEIIMGEDEDSKQELRQAINKKISADKEIYFQCEDRDYDNCAKNLIALA
jgi:hypothetical protein